MPEGSTHATSRLGLVSVVLSVAALAFFAVGMLLSWPRVAVLIVPVVLGAVALVLAVRARGLTVARVVAFVLAALAVVTPAVTVGAILVAGALAPSAVYTLTVDSPESVSVIVRDGADHQRSEWDGGRTITLDSNATVIGIGAQSSTPTTVISCEIRRDGRVLDSEERAGSVDCSVDDG